MIWPDLGLLHIDGRLGPGLDWAGRWTCCCVTALDELPSAPVFASRPGPMVRLLLLGNVAPLGCLWRTCPQEMVTECQVGNCMHQGVLRTCSLLPYAGGGESQP